MGSACSCSAAQSSGALVPHCGVDGACGVFHSSTDVALPPGASEGRAFVQPGSGMSLKLQHEVDPTLAASAGIPLRPRRKRRPLVAASFTSTASAQHHGPQSHWGAQRSEGTARATTDQRSPLRCAPVAVADRFSTGGAATRIFVAPNLMGTPPPGNTLRTHATFRSGTAASPLEVDVSYHISQGDPFGCDNERSCSGRSHPSVTLL